VEYENYKKITLIELSRSLFPLLHSDNLLPFDLSYHILRVSANLLEMVKLDCADIVKEIN